MNNWGAASTITEILEIAELIEVAYPRPDLAGGYGEIWDITLPGGDAAVRLVDDDGQIVLYLFTGGRAHIESGRMTFRHNLAAPAYVAAALEQIVADYISLEV